MTHTPADMHGPGPESAADWDAHYAASDLVWGADPNRYVVQHAGPLPPGVAVDIACGEGRNALYLAQRGWRVTAVDYSAIAIDKARRIEAARMRDDEVARSAAPIRWICADAASFVPDPIDLAIIVYAHLPLDARRAVLRHAAGALRPGGRILVVGHNTRNIAEGTGGPQDPAILYTADDLIDDVGKVAPRLRIEVAAEPLREVPGADRPAIDTVLMARNP